MPANGGQTNTPSIVPGVFYKSPGFYVPPTPQQGGTGPLLPACFRGYANNSQTAGRVAFYGALQGCSTDFGSMLRLNATDYVIFNYCMHRRVNSLAQRKD